jgi:AraC-like DNA-binding protein
MQESDDWPSIQPQANCPVPPSPPLLSNYPALRTSDVEYARDRLISAFGATSFEVLRGDVRFEARANYLQVGDLGLCYCAYAGDVSLGFGEDPFIRQVFNIDGRLRYSGSMNGEVASGACSGVFPAGVPLKFDFKARYRHLLLRIERDALQRYLSVLLGQEIENKLIFDDVTDQLAAMRRLRRMIFQFASDFNARGEMFSELAAAEMARIVIMKFLMYHRHNYTHLLLRQPLKSTSSTVKTVEEYIEANWDKPIDIEAMAAIARVSARSLFRQFRKDRGYSPADFAKRIRLERARDILEQSDGSVSVTQVALKCGFQNSGHFARDFRLAYGELPSDTLRRRARRPIA